MKPNENAQQHWRSLQHLAETPEIREQLANEFPGYEPGDMISTPRRNFLKLAAASLALAGVSLTGCRRWPKENVVEHTSRPPGRIPGEPEFYATSMELAGHAQPLVVRAYDGRPIKIEGNAAHPATRTFGGKLGASTLFAQASLLEMYDPERSRHVIDKTTGQARISKYETFLTAAVGQFKSTQGAGCAVLHEATSSPTFAATLARLKTAYPAIKSYEYEPTSRDNEVTAAKASFGVPLRQVYDLTQADVVVLFDADLLGSHPAQTRYGNDWSKRRRMVDLGKDATMNRVYIAESTLSTTGTVADVRMPARVSAVEKMVAVLAARLGLTSVAADLSPTQAKWVDRAYADLRLAQGKALVAGGAHLRPEILQLINAINGALNSFGSTISLVPGLDADRPTHAEAIAALVNDLNDGTVKSLLIIGGNPVFDAPADLAFAAALSKATFSAHLSLYANETSRNTKWHVNRAHYLESWGDSRTWDGTLGIQQPLIEPLFEGKTPIELLAALAGDTIAEEAKKTGYSVDQSIVRRTWATGLGAGSLGAEPVAFEVGFRKVLHDGMSTAPVAVKPPAAVTAPKSVEFAAPGDFEVRFLADYTQFDGRFANNGWLHECPDPVTKLAWDNAAYVSYADAKKLGIETTTYQGSLVEVEVGGKSLEIVAYILPGQPEGMITLPLGYGREVSGTIGTGVGFKTYDIRQTTGWHVATGAKLALSSKGGTYALAMTQDHHLIDNLGFAQRSERVGPPGGGGKIIHESTFAEFRNNPQAPHSAAHKLLPLQLWKGPYEPGEKRPGGPYAFNQPHAWGMAIDMNTCIGCNACVVACQSENNVPIVGKSEVIRNREMHWIRIDRYFKGTVDDPNPEVVYQPMMCVHCENAPCEQVCPVAATVHDTEGLNVMVYNRCIGTRYCNNNCPYKVRRFNFLDYQSRSGQVNGSTPEDFKTPWLGIPDTQQSESIDKIRQMIFNPEVTVRMRGVMEKCSYCSQRIKRATIAARNQWLGGERPDQTEPVVRDFEAVTACQEACPVEAIVFGNLNDPDSLVSRLQKPGGRAYGVLEELGNRPRSLHLAKIRNVPEESA